MRARAAATDTDTTSTRALLLLLMATPDGAPHQDIGATGTQSASNRDIGIFIRQTGCLD